MKFDMTKKSATIFSVALTIFLVILFAVLSHEGVVRRNSSIRLGYVETSTSSTWEARYASLQGSMTKMINIKSDSLDVSVTTDSGSISIEITDMDGNSLYRGKDLETCSFSVGATGKVKITVNAERHSGSFSFKQGR